MVKQPCKSWFKHITSITLGEECDMVNVHVSAGQQGCEYVARDLHQSVEHGIRIQEVI